MCRRYHDTTALHQQCIANGLRTLWCYKIITCTHDDVIIWKYFTRYWPFVRGIHRSPVDSPHKGQSRGAMMFSLICVWTNGWANSWETGHLRRHRAHYDDTVMTKNRQSHVMSLSIAITHSEWTYDYPIIYKYISLVIYSIRITMKLLQSASFVSTSYDLNQDNLQGCFELYFHCVVWSHKYYPVCVYLLATWTAKRVDL